MILPRSKRTDRVTSLNTQDHDICHLCYNFVYLKTYDVFCVIINRIVFLDYFCPDFVLFLLFFILPKYHFYITNHCL
jgi:hypothetical protein